MSKPPAFTAAELARQPAMRAGQRFVCSSCGETHAAVAEGDMLLYQCAGRWWLCGYAGRSVMALLTRDERRTAR